MRWIEEAELRLTAAGQGPLMRGETPPSLTHIAFTRKIGLQKLSKEERALCGHRLPHGQPAICRGCPRDHVAARLVRPGPSR